MESFTPRKMKEADRDSLWYLVHEKLSSKIAAYNIQVNTGDLKRAIMSIQSVTGGLAEKLVAETGSFILSGLNVNDRVVRDNAFKSTVADIKTRLRESSDPLILQTAMQQLSSEYYVSNSYGEDVLTDKVDKVTYPDLVVLRHRGPASVLFACEQKLSGDNDSKATLKNLEELSLWKERLIGNFTVETAVLLPFSGEPMRMRWERPKDVKLKPDWVLVNGQVWEKLFDLPAPEKWYGSTVDALAETAADLFAITLLGDSYDYDIDAETLSVAWHKKDPAQSHADAEQLNLEATTSEDGSYS